MLFSEYSLDMKLSVCFTQNNNNHSLCHLIFERCSVEKKCLSIKAFFFFFDNTCLLKLRYISINLKINNYCVWLASYVGWIQSGKYWTQTGDFYMKMTSHLTAFMRFCLICEIVCGQWRMHVSFPFCTPEKKISSLYILKYYIITYYVR